MFPILSVLIVFGPFFGITQDLVGLVYFLKLPLGFFIVGVEVGMVFSCQFSIGFFDFISGGIFAYIKYLIIIDKLHILLMLLTALPLDFPGRNSKNRGLLKPKVMLFY